MGEGCLHGLMSDAMLGAGSARGLRKLCGGQRLSPPPRAVGFVRLCDDGRPATLASCGFKPDASLAVRPAPTRKLVGAKDGCLGRPGACCRGCMQRQNSADVREGIDLTPRRHRSITAQAPAILQRDELCTELHWESCGIALTATASHTSARSTNTHCV